MAINHFEIHFRIIILLLLFCRSWQIEKWFIHYFDNGRKTYNENDGLRIYNEAKNIKDS